MNLIVIGGHTRNIGKTSVAAALIAATKDRNWTALKISQYGHGICSASGEPCGCEIEDPECPYAITRETDPNGPSDTARLLQAGAKESYWVRTPMGQLKAAIPELERLLANRENVIIESNSILEFWKPTLYIPVLNYANQDLKPSSRRYLDQADAFVVVNSASKQPTWQGIDSQRLSQKPIFQVDAPEYACPQFTSFCANALVIARS